MAPPGAAASAGELEPGAELLLPAPGGTRRGEEGGGPSLRRSAAARWPPPRGHGLHRRRGRAIAAPPWPAATPLSRRAAPRAAGGRTRHGRRGREEEGKEGARGPPWPAAPAPAELEEAAQDPPHGCAKARAGPREQRPSHALVGGQGRRLCPALPCGGHAKRASAGSSSTTLCPPRSRAAAPPCARLRATCASAELEAAGAGPSMREVLRASRTGVERYLGGYGLTIRYHRGGV